jgi:very-short-patch-repair endonuclease
VTGGVLGFESNLAVRTTSGKNYRGDLVFPERRVILDYRGDHHREQEQYRRDLRRRMDLQADGWTIVELGPDDLGDPGLARRVRAILARAAHRGGGG